LVHIVPDTLGDGLPFQLAEHRGNVHHGPTHGAGGVEALPDRNKVDAEAVELLDQPRKVADIAADPVQSIDHHRPELPLPGGLHHLFEAGPVEVAAREALILIDHGAVGAAVAISAADIAAAQLHLVAHALALAGEPGLAGVDGNDIFVGGLLHKGSFPDR